MQSNLPVDLLKDLSGKDLVLFESSQDSSLFRNLVYQFGNFCNYVRAHYVIGHPKVGMDNSGVDLSNIENRFTIHGLQ